MTTIIVKDITRGEIVAQGNVDDTVILLEGAYYFAPDEVNQAHLVVSNRTYTCAYKGTCNWVDLESPNGVVRDVGWVYSQPRPDYEYIRDKVGFAFGMRPGIIVEKA